MAFTREGNRKLAARLKAKGVDENGKSLHHKRAGQAASHNQPSYFAKLAETPEGRAELAKIARKGAQASNTVQGKGTGSNKEVGKESEAA